MIRILWVSLFVFLPVIQCTGQEVFYYAGNMRPVATELEAIFAEEVHQKSKKKYVINILIKKDETWIAADRQKIRIKRDGRLRILIRGKKFFPKKVFREISLSEPGLYYFEEIHKGITIREGNSSRYIPLQLEGTIYEFHSNERKKSVSFFKENQLISNQNWKPDGSPYIDSIYYSADQEPNFLPGNRFFNDYLMQQIKVSKLNLEEYEDRVVIAWVIMENGLMDGVIAQEGRSLQLNNLLVNIIAQMPGEWEPAVLDGKPVRYFMSIPLNFEHHDAKFQDVEFNWGVLHYNKY